MYVFIANLRADIYWLMYIESFNVPCVHVCMHACCHFSRARLFATLGTIAHQALLWDSPGKNSRVGAMPHPGDLPNPGVEPLSLKSPALAVGFFITSTTWEALISPKKCHFIRKLIMSLFYPWRTKSWRVWVPSTSIRILVIEAGTSTVLTYLPQIYLLLFFSIFHICEVFSLNQYIC